MQPNPVKSQPESPLSPQMTAVLCCLVRGMTYAQAAREMGLSIHTVKSYASRAFGRLGTKSRVQAVAIAVAQHLIEVYLVEIKMP